jgi:hypothetical protein
LRLLEVVVGHDVREQSTAEHDRRGCGDGSEGNRGPGEPPSLGAIGGRSR